MKSRKEWCRHCAYIGALVLFILLSAAGCAPHREDGSQGNAASGVEASGYGQEAVKDGTVSEAVADGAEEDSESEALSTENFAEQEDFPFIISEGNTLSERIAAPKGYERTPAAERSLAQFLRNYPMKEDGAPVLLYNGRKKGNQSAQAAVFRLPIESENLQQCADSVMRVYAEYYWTTEQYDKIRFHFSDGFAAEYVKWREGYRIRVDGDRASWTAKNKPYDDSYENFQKYMRIVFAYAGTASMESEATKIALSELQAGDVFLKGGSPGHVVMVVDLCENVEGKKAFLLAQGYMPAQEFHVLKNPLHGEDPWYYEEEVSYPFITPEYVFPEGSLKRLEY